MASGSVFFSGESFVRPEFTDAVVVAFISVRDCDEVSLLGMLVASLVVSTCGVAVGVTSCTPAGAGLIGVGATVGIFLGVAGVG